MDRRHMFGAACALACTLAGAGPAAGQVPLPPLPPVGGLPPGSGKPRPSRPPAPGPVSKAPGSVSENVDVAHTGHLTDDSLVPPLTPRWSVRAQSPVLAAGGRVFAARNRLLMALDARNGRRLWATKLVSGVSGAAYDGGRLFVCDGTNLIALSARTGARLWNHAFGDREPGSPVAAGGAVYITDDPTGPTRAYAFRARDGALLWAPEGTAAPIFPTVDNAHVYLPGAGSSVNALRRSDGGQDWERGSRVTGSRVLAAALHAGRLWVPDIDSFDPSYRNPVLSAANGHVIRHFTGELPVFVDGFAINTERDRVTAVREASGKRAWRRGMEEVGRLVSVGHDVYAAVPGHVRALNPASGRTIWSARLRRRFPEYAPELAVAPGLLLVVHAGRLTAWQSVFQPSPSGIDAGATSFDVFAGERFWVGGVIGSRLRPARPRVRIERARWRHGGFRRYRSVRAARDGFFQSPVRLLKNSRLRAHVAHARSRPFTVYAYPRVKLGRGRLNRHNHVVLRARVSARGTRLSGRRFVLYYSRRKSRRIRRLDSGRIRGHRVTLVFRRVRHASRRDLVYFCVRGALKLGLTRPSPLSRRCGRTHIRL